MTENVDVVVLGGGSGGYVCAIRAAQLGLSVALVEEKRVGGTCLHRGCIPTKSLLQTAALVDAIAHGDRLGVRVGSADVDWAAAQKRKQQVVDQLTKGVEFLLKKHRVRRIDARGRLDGPRTVVAGDTTIGARAVVLATGSRPRSLPGLEVDGRRVLTSDEALLLDHVPASAVVLGAGAIGVEFASLWRSLGSDVSLVEVAETLVPLEDADVGRELQKQFEARGVRCLPAHRLDPASLAVDDSGVAVTVAPAGGGAEVRLQAEVLLVAVGRAQNTEEIGIDELGVDVGRGGVVVDDHLRTGEDGVYAVGDIVGGFWLAHKAMHEGVIAAETIAGADTHPLDARRIPRTTYCTPQVGSIGLSEQEARTAGYDVRCGTFPFRGNARALIWGEPGGFCKVVADATTNDVLGVHVIGHEVTELIAGPGLGLLLEATPLEMGRAVAPHPTLSEVIGEAALAVSGEAIHI